LILLAVYRFTVRAIAPEAAELNIIEVRFLAVEFMPGPVKRAHAAIALNPNTHVEQIEANGAAGGEHLAHVAPILAGVDDGVGGGVRARKL
jgi:hypothetical protein